MATSPVLQLIITAKDEASAAFGKLFKALNDSTNVIATQVRNGFTNLFGGAVDSAAAFEQQLGKVQAKGDKSYADLGKLKTGLQAIAAQYGITGTEAAQGMEVLAAAGLNATDAMKALPAVLNLAKMENLSLDDAATKLSDTLSIVGLGFDQAGRMADVLAKGANISTASAASLAEALSVAGGQAKSAGMDLEATVAALDLLHSAGIKGSAAGTALAAILTQLQNPTSKASQELSKLGITSRDLGDVLDGLKQAGSKSGAAVLAFGETAGPGLQAMIGKGSAGLKAFEVQLRAADGSAAAAATQLSNNFNGALGALAAAWDSVKVAVAEPILQPIADGAREVAKALNTALNDGALKPVQAAIKAFAENGVTAIREFVGSFDFSQVLPALKNFATSASEWLGNIKTAGQTAADVVSGAWNTLATVFNGVAAAVSGVATLIVGDFLLIVTGLNKIGLVSDETQAKWEAGFEAMKQRTQELADRAVSSGKQAGEAFTRLGTDTDTAGEALNRLKNQLPTEEIKALQAQVTAYADALKLADPSSQAAVQYATQLKEAQEALNRALSNATVAAQAATAATADLAAKTAQAQPPVKEYQALWQKTADGLPQLTEAHLKLGGGVADVARVVGGAQAEMKEWNGTLVKNNEGVTVLWDGLNKFVPTVRSAAEVMGEYSRRITYANDMAAGWSSGMELNGVKMLGLRDAAQATAEKLAYLKSIKDTLPEADRKIAEATAQDTAALNRYNTALAENVTQAERAYEAAKRATELGQKDYDLKLQQVDAEKELALVKGDTEAATRKETEATELQTQKAQAAIAGKVEEIAKYKDLIESVRLRLAADGELNASDKGELATMADKLTAMEQERQGMAQSKASTEELTAAKKAKVEADREAKKAAEELAATEKEAAAQLKAAGDAVNSNLGAVQKVFAETGGDVEKLTAAFNAMRASTNSALSADKWVAWSAAVAANADKVVESYNNQKSALDSNVATLQRFADEGGNVAEVQQIMIQGSFNLADQYELLNQQDLDNLQSAIEGANQKLRDMQQEAQDAQAALAEMNAEILAEQGDTAGAERLRLQIDQSQKLADLEQKRLEAERTGNKEAERTYQTMIDKLNELYALKGSNLEAELAAQKAADKTAESSKTAAGKVNELATGMERLATATRAVDQGSLSNLTGQFDALKSKVEALHGMM